MSLCDLKVSSEITIEKALKKLRKPFLVVKWEECDLDLIIAFEARRFFANPYMIHFMDTERNSERLSSEELVQGRGFTKFPTLLEEILYITEMCKGKKGGLPMELVHGRSYACLGSRFNDGGVPLIRFLVPTKTILISWGHPELFRDFRFHRVEVEGYQE
ncbi:MAG: hypothetical protein WCX12_02445 [Candidatus Paceibacterota bacterium]|jgi:hypothetical protein